MYPRELAELLRQYGRINDAQGIPDEDSIILVEDESGVPYEIGTVRHDAASGSITIEMGTPA